MILHLFSDKTGFFCGNDKSNIRTEPQIDGILMIDDIKIEISRDKKTSVVLPQKSVCRCTFTDKFGNAYNIGFVRVVGGLFRSDHDVFDAFIDSKHTIDELQKKIEDLTEKYYSLKSKIEYDSIGFLTGEDEK